VPSDRPVAREEHSMNPTIVSGAVATLTDLGRDEGCLQGWLKEEPGRLGLGALSVDPSTAEDGAMDGTFVASQDGRCFSVDVQLGELDASHGFGVLDAWARNKAREPEKDHVAVLVTETCGDRYRTTLETLAKHLPLVVVELAVWRGENEALVIPHVALASEGVDLGAAPASAAAAALARTRAAADTAAAHVRGASKPEQKAAAGKPEGSATDAKSDGEARAEMAEGSQDGEAGKVEPPANKDDTGVADPWGLPAKEPEAATAGATGNGSRLLSKFNT
jgi:hypothetical protein